MQIAMSKTREQFPLSQKKPLKKTLEIFVPGVTYFAVILLVVGIMFSTVLKNYSWFVGIFFIAALSIAAILLLSILITYNYQIWYFQTYFYDVADDFIIIKKGVITPREITIPYERIQDVYMDQYIFDRMFKLYNIHLSSATASSGIEAHIDGLEKEAADALKKVILEKINEKIKQAKKGDT